MKKRQLVVLLASMGVACIVIGVAAYVAYSRRPKPMSLTQHPVTAAQLAAADGKRGHKCYVAIDGTVYEIIDSAFWKDGEHTPSDGQAYCGADLSKVIDQAPHGRNILKILPVIGPLRT
jgi:predicted heme/steroid binding protein